MGVLSCCVPNKLLPRALLPKTDAEMGDAPYVYPSLGEYNSTKIRILHLRPGEDNDSIFVEISCEELVSGIEPYSALSWQWGDETPTQTIRIKNDKHPSIWRLKVRRNLLAALKQLRDRHKTVRLWVDAICIKQEPEDDPEKSAQISLMTKIYGMAKEVCVWLGEASDDSDIAIRFVNKLVNLDDENHVAGLDRRPFDPDQAKELEALIKLLKRGWFSRRWVVQEIAMARRATLHCGRDSVDWSKLADAIALLEKVGRDGSISRTLKKHATSESRPSEYVGSFSSLPAYRLVQNTTGMFRGQERKDIRTWRYTLEELVSFLAAFQASRLHDTIYALLGLSSDVKPEPPGLLVTQREFLLPDTQPLPRQRARSNSRGLRRIGTAVKRGVTDTIKVDYSLAPLQVFQRFLEHAIARSESLDIICRPWAPERGVDARGNLQEVKLPSWIPSLKRKPFQPTRHGDMVRFNPDPLVGPASFRHRFYSASGLTVPNYKFLTPSDDLSDEITPELQVEGFPLGVIGCMWDSGSFGNVPAMWLKAGEWEKETEAPPDDLWRALVADRNAAGDDPDRWYPMVFRSAAKDRRITYGFETHRLIHESTNAMVAELFRRVQAVVWNRKLMRVTGGFAHWLKENEESKEGGGAGELDSDDEDEKSAIDDGQVLNGPAVETPGKASNGTLNGPERASDTAKAREPDDKKGVLGLCPSDAELGDLVCVIFGCSVPLVLRRIEGREERYRLIGECYLDHAMDGEAMTYFEKKLAKKYLKVQEEECKEDAREERETPSKKEKQKPGKKFILQ